MIKGLSADNARPLPQQTAKRKTEKADFAEQLLGAKSDESRENQKRTERQTSGRDSDREDRRSAEREHDSRSSKSDSKKRPEKRPDKPREQVRETNASPVPRAAMTPIPQPTTRVPASDDDSAPIIVEKPKGTSDSQELQLPDFFSKAALEKGATTDAKATLPDGTDAVSTASQMASMKEYEGLSRQEAMEKFVNKMNDELGIPPQKLLAAFAKMNDSAMQAAPEASMGEFLDNLDVDQATEMKAATLYKDLLKTTGDSLMNEKLAGLDQSVNFDVMSPRDNTLRKLDNSLEDLNKSFFRKEPTGKEKAQKELESMNVAVAKLMDGAKSAEAGGATAMGSENALAAQMALAQQQDVGDLGDADASADAEGSKDNSQRDLLAALGLSTAAGASKNAQAESNLSDLLGGQSESSLTGGASNMKTSLKSAFAEEMAKTDKDESVEAESTAALKTDAKIDPRVSAQADIAPGSPKPVMGPADMMMNKPATAKDEQENVKELIKQAQIMVKRGGGEMKMEMKPEGMGTVQLRVSVENGNVSVQMLTESESAKHLLEKGMHELKSNLAQHELKVQSMTVDVGNDVKNQMDQQATADQQRQKAQQFAHDFMGSFRDDNQGFRQGFLENKGLRSYARGKGPDSIQPEQVERAATKSRGDNSKRLNLVA